MELLTKDTKEIINIIKKETGNSPDIIFRELKLFNTDINIIANESMADKAVINNFILKYLASEKISNGDKKFTKLVNILKYLEETIPTHKITKVDNFDDLFYNLFSGFAIILINNYEIALALETKLKLDSGVADAKNERVIKGPKDAFTENYQINIGLIRKRIKSPDLWLEEQVIGTESKTKVGIMYVKDIASTPLVNQIVEKIKGIKIDGVFDSNYIIELISENKNNVFANYISTERPDRVSIELLNGRIAIIVENTQQVIIIPIVFIDFFHSPEDHYQKVINVNVTRIIRLIAFIITILGPAIYIALTTYNIEAVPEKLLISFSTQRQGVPLPTIVETLMMIIAFEIIRETDSRIPNTIGSSLSIVGALVLGEAAVAAGIVSPITIIVVAITAISGLIVSSIDVVNGTRWWRIIFMLFSSLAGLYGVFISGLLFIISLTSIKSFGIPYFTPFAPFYPKEQNNAIFLTNKRKFESRNSITAIKNPNRQEGD